MQLLLRETIILSPLEVHSLILRSLLSVVVMKVVGIRDLHHGLHVLGCVTEDPLELLLHNGTARAERVQREEASLNDDLIGDYMKDYFANELTAFIGSFSQGVALVLHKLALRFGELRELLFLPLGINDSVEEIGDGVARFLQPVPGVEKCRDVETNEGSDVLLVLVQVEEVEEVEDVLPCESAAVDVHPCALIAAPNNLDRGWVEGSDVFRHMQGEENLLEELSSNLKGHGLSRVDMRDTIPSIVGILVQLQWAKILDEELLLGDFHEEGNDHTQCVTDRKVELVKLKDSTSGVDFLLSAEKNLPDGHVDVSLFQEELEITDIG